MGELSENVKAIDVVKQMVADGQISQDVAENYFPELKESEGERMWKLIKKYAHSNISDMALNADHITREQLESWIEKQSKQNLTNKIKPKFHEGEWVVNKFGDAWHIDSFDSKNYQVSNSNGDKYCYFPIEKQNEMHLWTIQDVKDGDVLFTSSTASHETFIFKSIDESGNAECYFAYDSEDGFREGKYHFIGSAINCKPATKKQYDTLMKVMTDRGYTFDFKKKELKKIEQKPLQWNISDYRTWQYIVADVLTKHDGIGQYLDNGFCKKIAKYMQEEWSKKLCLIQHTSWSEKDESMLTRCIGILGKCYMGELPTKVEEELNWLKYLSDRVQLQPKQELSKEDEDTIKFLINHFCVSHCNRSFQFTDDKLITHDELLEKIRNLKPHWKPNDNQMDALDYYANSICTYSDRQDDLRSLFNDLKKLITK